jgi:hypothetical protein
MLIWGAYGGNNTPAGFRRVPIYLSSSLEMAARTCREYIDDFDEPVGVLEEQVGIHRE